MMNKRHAHWRGTLGAALLVLSSWLAAPAVHAQGCDPTQACCAGGAGTGTPACGAAAGNPLNLMNGNKFQVEVDMPALPGVLGLEIVRTYNSANAGINGQRGILGRGWRLSYDAELIVAGSGGSGITLIQADGTEVHFHRALIQPRAGTLYQSNQGQQGELIARRIPGQGAQFFLTLPDKSGQQFNSQGKLIQITAATGEFVALQRDTNGQLLKVTDPQGRTLSLRYLDKESTHAGNQYRGVQHIDSPVGRFSYTYGSTGPKGTTAEPNQLLANLVQVSLPSHYDSGTPAHLGANRGTTSSTVKRQYHYEDPRWPTLLTGISVTGSGSDQQPVSQRLVTWAYDTKGRANLSVKGEAVTGKAGVEQVTLDFSGRKPDGSGVTRLTNSLGQDTLYTYAMVNGRQQLIEVRGPGCATCAPSNVRHRFDARGRATHQIQLDDAGRELHADLTEYDGADRPIRVSRVWYQGKSGKNQQTSLATAPQLLVRYEYGTDPYNQQPTLMARPSVVQGQEHQIRIETNARGQVTRISERGLSPLDANGQTIALSSARASALATPIERSRRYAYAVINGRSVLSEVDGPLPNGPKGTPEDSDITRYTWDARADYLVSITQPGGFSSKVDYDGAGRVATVQNDEGFRTTYSYSASQLAQTSSTGPGWAKPRVESYKYDALAHRTETGTGSLADGTYRAQRGQGFDAQGRPEWTASAQGVLEQIRYNTESQPLQIGRYSGAMAQVQNFAYDKQAPLLTPGPAPLRSRSLVDDFGRTVATLSPDSGITTRAFDAANRLIGSTDAQNNRAVYTHDAAGRIQSQTITAASPSAGPAITTRWVYQGRRLIALEHPTQSEHYAYDTRGLRTARIVTLQSNPAHTPSPALTAVTRYEYDDEGQLVATSLPDGSTLQYQRNGQSQVVALLRQSIQTPWLRWLSAGQTIASDLQRDMVGLKSFTSGNGIQAQFQRSSQGHLARVVYRHNKARPALTARGVNGPAMLMGRTTQETIERLLGIGHAQAASADAAPVMPTATQAWPGALGLPADPQALIDHRYLWDERGNLLYSEQSGPQTSDAPQTESYAYDAQSRLIAGVRGNAAVWRYAYDAHGRRVLSQEGASTQSDLQTGTRRTAFAPGAHRLSQAGQQTYRYNASGQPETVGQREYVWDALGRLVEVREEAQPLAHYQYDHRGLRNSKRVGEQTTHTLYDESRQPLAELDGQGRITRQYIYLTDMALAVIDRPHPLAPQTPGVAQVLSDLGQVLQSWLGADEGLVWLHTNHLDAPEAATDAAGQLVWQASYAPFGAASVQSAGDFTLNLRLPGQYFDGETTLHYNRARYYDPAQGQYLSPDPLGTPDGHNGYAYVRFNPLKYVDPDGLVLFAFDGTGNSNPAPNGDTISNVEKFRQAYDEEANGRAFYITGIGTTNADMSYKGNMANGDGFDQRVDLGFTFLDRFVNANHTATETVQIDVVGFSRGAAEARVWINQLVSRWDNGLYTTKEGNSRCLNLRFEGLWDTVPHLGYLNGNESKYNFTIPAAVKYAAQAVALNEQRGGLANFNALSILNAPANSSGGNRNEVGFIGSHADIGGGYGTGDLSNAALMWMVAQGTAQGIKFDSDTIAGNGWNVISNPIVHDKSNNKDHPGQVVSDRTFTYGDGQSVAQHDAMIGGYDTASASRMVNYYKDWCGPIGAPAVGLVDAQKYEAWLKSQGVNVTITAPTSTPVCQ